MITMRLSFHFLDCHRKRLAEPGSARLRGINRKSRRSMRVHLALQIVDHNITIRPHFLCPAATCDNRTLLSNAVNRVGTNFRMWRSRCISQLVNTAQQRGTNHRAVFSVISLDSSNAVKGNTRQVRVYEIRDGVDQKTPTASVSSDIVNHQRPSSFACKIDIGPHHMFSDVKIIEKGADVGPSPKEICYSALGSCTVMTLRTYFENTKAIKGSSWANCHLTRISIIMIEVMGSAAHVPEGVNMILELEGNLSVLHKERLLRAADNCPVKKMMSGGLKINVAIAFNSDTSKAED